MNTNFITDNLPWILSEKFHISNLLEKQIFWNCIIGLYIIITILILWKKRKYRVDCWFCRQKSYIPKAEINWWFCSSCEQFNGFGSDGDYRRDIPDMFSNAASSPRYCQSNPEPQPQKNLLCDKCHQNQTIKFEKIRAFEPANEAIFEWEFAEYEKYLNQKYGLCKACDLAFKREIHAQDTQIKEMYSEEFEKRKPKQGLRKLKKRNDQWRFIGGKQLLPMSILMLSFIPVNIDLFDNELIGKESILLMTSMIAVVFHLMLFLLRTRLHWLQCISFVLWSNLLYNHYKQRLVRTPLTLKLTALIEFVSACLQLVRCLSRKFKERRFLRSRRSKLDRLTFVRNRGFFDDSTVTFESDRTSEITEETPDHQSSVLSDNGDDNIIESSSLHMNSNILSNKVSRQPIESTPDILHGHLDSMFIERRNQTHKSARDTSANHVVAALKYNIKRSESLPSMAKPPLIRPATFLYKSSNARAENNVPLVEHRTKEQESHDHKIQAKLLGSVQMTSTAATLPMKKSDGQCTRSFCFKALFFVSIFVNGFLLYLYFFN